ncbi:hypothetical protein DICSQDRAFT_140718 [Dichomitus squalens LYAD-421 SS1]|uniref:Uncharacterized protein n=1 Tax=Dichomitus squalens (strain LYAD-421) TaxID=732165 RepID=R7SMD3_DICSQ|nr:uncharacterized protein DICSQDRAFT_140718 [Dichomitus squalens LYAD-421 SS1]EJF57048.1 hypothetical protein DICSQDRAFT_140718 [Dichomitus squalens LYAD-421 SS1]
MYLYPSAWWKYASEMPGGAEGVIDAALATLPMYATPGICAHTRTYRHLRLGGRSVRGEAYHVASNQRLI